MAHTFKVNPAKLHKLIPGEHHEHRVPGNPKFDRIMAKAKKHGFKPKVVSIEVNAQGHPYIADGNTHTAVAAKLGVKSLKARVRYHGGKNKLPLKKLKKELSVKGYAEGGKVKLPETGYLPGDVHLDPTIAPVVPEGAARPFAPGEYVQNPNGSWSSEISMTVPMYGGFVNIPSLWLKDGRPYRAQNEDEATDLAYASRLGWPVFPSWQAADKAAAAREDAWQNLAPDDPKVRNVPPLYTGKGYTTVDPVVVTARRRNALQDILDMARAAVSAPSELIKGVEGVLGTEDRWRPYKRGGSVSQFAVHVARGGHTDEGKWKRIVASVKAGGKGGAPGQWSARKAQLATQRYQASGGGYRGPKTEAQKSLSKWTKEDWGTKSGKPSTQGPKATGERYLPKKAREALTPAEYAATTRAKREGSAKGKQFVKQPDRIAKKTARYR